MQTILDTQFATAQDIISKIPSMSFPIDKGDFVYEHGEPLLKLHRQEFDHNEGICFVASVEIVELQFEFRAWVGIYEIWIGDEQMHFTHREEKGMESAIENNILNTL